MEAPHDFIEVKIERDHSLAPEISEYQASNDTEPIYEFKYEVKHEIFEAEPECIGNNIEVFAQNHDSTSSSVNTGIINEAKVDFEIKQDCDSSADGELFISEIEDLIKDGRRVGFPNLALKAEPEIQFETEDNSDNYLENFDDSCEFIRSESKISRKSKRKGAASNNSKVSRQKKKSKTLNITPSATKFPHSTKSESSEPNKNLNDELPKRKKPRSKGSADKSLTCYVCDMNFSNKSDLRVHMRIHTSGNPCQCKLCDKWLLGIVNLKTHLRTHTGEQPFRCKICDKRFSDSTNLKRHSKLHSGERLYQCEVCRKEFTYKCNLSSHMRTHTGEQPFQCKQCSKRFSDSSTFKRHVRLHTGERPFQCKVCDCKLNRNYELVRHMRTHSKEGS